MAGGHEQKRCAIVRQPDALTKRAPLRIDDNLKALAIDRRVQHLDLLGRDAVEALHLLGHQARMGDDDSRVLEMASLERDLPLVAAPRRQLHRFEIAGMRAAANRDVGRAGLVAGDQGPQVQLGFQAAKPPVEPQIAQLARHEVHRHANRADPADFGQRIIEALRHHHRPDAALVKPAHQRQRVALDAAAQAQRMVRDGERHRRGRAAQALARGTRPIK